MRNAVIVYKNDAKAASLARHTDELLRGAGFATWLESSDPEDRGSPPPDFRPGLIVSLGGDGTLLYAARSWGLNGAPLLGVNMGSLGFLAETEPEHFEELLKETIAGRYRVEERFALDVTIERQGQAVTKVAVVNDVVINKGALARIMQMSIEVSADGRKLGAWTYRADGLILATPTGSTAYNLSAGGPVVYPALPAVIVTPICPFTLSSRPLILPSDLEIAVGMDAKSSDAHLSADGQTSFPLRPLDRVLARRSAQGIRLVVNPRRHFFDIMSHKLGWPSRAG